MTPSQQRLELSLTVLAVAFGWLAALSLWLQSHDPVILTAMLLLTVCGVLAHFWLNKFAPERDIALLPIALALTAWGFVVTARVAVNFLPRQETWMVIGLVALCAVVASRDRLRWLRRYKYTWLIAALGLLGATLLLGVNPTGVGARLWLSVGGLFVQPSEILRLLMIAFLAAYFSERVAVGQWSVGSSGERWHLGLRGHTLQEIRKSFAPLAPTLAMWLVALALLASQQDLGAATLLLLTYAFMLYLATGQLLLPGLGLVMLAFMGVIGYQLSSRVALRINIWLNPFSDAKGTSFQIVQSLIAVASGGVFGQGPGQGRPDYVPAVHTDFPFAAIGEEFGLIGALAVLALFAILIMRAWRIARSSPSAYALLLAGGIAALFVIQVLVIIGGNLGLLPLTGVTLPFISYGGSSLLVSYTAVGLLIRLSSDQHTPIPVPVLGSPGATSNGDSLYQPIPVQRVAARYSMLLCAGLVVVLGFTTGYRDTLEQEALVTRSDNPRNVDAERAIDRGSILARNGSILAVSRILKPASLYTPPIYTRIYPHPDTAPVVGYYSIQHGLGGIEAYDDVLLRGQLTPLDQLMHDRQRGGTITTTIDLTEQSRLANVLTGTIGSGIVMDWRTGQILAMVSNPTFDPNLLDVNWDKLRARSDAPLVNRATQGLYQPGALLSWIYSEGKDASPTDPLPHWDPQDRFHLGQPVPFELPNASVPYPATSTYSETIGQGTLRLSPLRVAVTVAGFAANEPVTPTLILTKTQVQLVERPPHIATRFSGLAQTSQATRVGWYVRIAGWHVTVLAVEISGPSTDSYDRIVQQMDEGAVQ